MSGEAWSESSMHIDDGLVTTCMDANRFEIITTRPLLFSRQIMGADHGGRIRSRVR